MPQLREIFDFFLDIWGGPYTNDISTIFGGLWRPSLFRNLSRIDPMSAPEQSLVSAAHPILTGSSGSTLRSPPCRSRGRAQSHKGKAHRVVKHSAVRHRRPVANRPVRRERRRRAVRLGAALRRAGTLRFALLPTGVRLLLRRRASHANDGTAQRPHSRHRTSP